MEISTTAPTLPAAPRAADKPAVAAPAAATQPGAAEPATSQAVTQPGATPSAAQLDEALRNINKTMLGLSQAIEFSVDPDTDRTIVKVIDQDTKEVIRQMPSAETLEIAKALDRVQGLLIRQKA